MFDCCGILRHIPGKAGDLGSNEAAQSEDDGKRKHDGQHDGEGAAKPQPPEQRHQRRQQERQQHRQRDRYKDLARKV